MAIFSLEKADQGPIYLEKYTESEPQVAEDWTEIVIPRSPRQARELPVEPKVEGSYGSRDPNNAWSEYLDTRPKNKSNNYRNQMGKYDKRDVEGKDCTSIAKLLAPGNNQRYGL